MGINDKRTQGLYHLVAIFGIPLIALSAWATGRWWVPVLVCASFIGATIFVVRLRTRNGK